MDLPAVLIQHLASQMRPDNPSGVPSQAPLRPIHPTGYRTAFVGGRWVLVPTGFASGKSTLPPPRVTVRPPR